MLAEQLKHSTVVSADGWSTDLQTCSFNSIGPVPDSLNLGGGLEVIVACSATGTKPAQIGTVKYSVEAVVSATIQRVTNPSGGFHQVRFVPRSGNQEIIPGLNVPDPHAADFFFNALGSIYIPDQDLITRDIGSLYLSSSAERDFTRFLRATAGDPNAFSNNLTRMTYFSATTITTLGLGDIVPIADRSRALVAAESVFGVIFVGLFLNSLAAKYLSTPDPSVTSDDVQPDKYGAVEHNSGPHPEIGGMSVA
jgi:hypothetical protein